jgi:subtilase family serine protease
MTTSNGTVTNAGENCQRASLTRKNWKKSIRKMLPVAVCALAVFHASPVAAQQVIGRQQLNGHVTAEMTNAPLVGRVAPSTQMTLTIGLVIRNSAELAQVASEIADPNSPSYRQYLTPEQFADRFGVSPAGYRSVLDWAQSNNLTATPHRNRFVATVSGQVADIEHALNIHLNYHLRSDGTQFFAPDGEPSVAFSVPVDHISGLSNFSPPERAGGSAPGGSYQGNDFRNAYAPGITLNGTGQQIGILMFDFDGFTQSDINGYGAQVGHSYLPVQLVPASTLLTPGIEGTLDVEAALSMAPAAQVVTFIGSDSTTILSEMTDRPGVRQFSSSWNWHDGTTTEQNLMQNIATNGGSFFQASGDGGPWPLNYFNCTSGSLDNRSYPKITIVGGTNLDMTGSGANYGNLETAWPDSAGGPEGCVGIPSWQKGVAGENGASGSSRNGPDVAAMANDFYLFYDGSPTNVGGTSEATPLWAGYMALVNELMENYGLASVGFADPTLYSIAATSAYDTNFHDVVSGCATDSGGLTYCAGSGYDLVTGLGSPTNTLIYTLSGVEVYPLYCQGPLTTTSNVTQFIWSTEAASEASPGPGECAWPNRAPVPVEIKSGGGNELVGTLKQVANLPAGKFAEVGVYRNQTSDDMIVTQIVGFVTPPFSSSVALP